MENGLIKETPDLKAALAFYAAYGVTTTDYTAAERERHYATLEQAGYIEKLYG